MEILLTMFVIQGILGAFDTIYHHELTERLPWRPSASKELQLHGIRNAFYSFIFLSLGWLTWNGIFAWIFAFLLIAEVFITLVDFVEEDRSRKLPATERITHTVLALNYGVILALLFPVIWQWSQAPTGFTHVNFGILSWIMTLYTAGAILWAWLDISRGRFWSGKSINEPVIEALTKSNQRILVTGGTGFIGRPLCQAFINQGHSVTVLTRNINNAAAQFRGRITFIESLDLLKDSDEFDIVINLAGEPISQRWSESARRKIIESRVNTTSALVEFIKRSQRKPSVFISGSAIGIYGTDEEKKFSETTQSVNDLIGQYPRTICEQWEAVAKEMESFHVRTCLLRTGVVLEIDGGALAQMLFPFGFCLGGRMGSGNQWFSWIHREDLIRLIVHLINNDDISGPVNATAPEPVTNKMFSKMLARAMGRPCIVPLPAFQVKLLFGEMGQALLLSGQKVLPQKVLDHGFKFTYRNVDEALVGIFRN